MLVYRDPTISGAPKQLHGSVTSVQMVKPLPTFLLFAYFPAGATYKGLMLPFMFLSRRSLPRLSRTT